MVNFLVLRTFCWTLKFLLRLEMLIWDFSKVLLEMLMVYGSIWLHSNSDRENPSPYIEIQGCSSPVKTMLTGPLWIPILKELKFLM